MFVRPGFLHAGSAAGGSSSAHGNYQPGQIHTPFNWVVANAAARLALVPSAADVYKALWQIDTNTIYILTDESPVTWQMISGGSALGPAFRAYNAGNQALSNSLQVVQYPTEAYDTKNAFSANVFTVPVGWDGIYSFVAAVSSADGSGFFPGGNINLYKNGVWLGIGHQTAGTARAYEMTLAIQANLVAGDVVDVRVSPGGAMNTAGGEARVFFAGFYVGPLAGTTVTPLTSKVTSLIMNANLSCGNGVSTAVPWSSSRELLAGSWIAGLPSRLTVPAGYVKAKFSAYLLWASNVNGVRVGEIKKNGITFVSSGTVVPNAAIGLQPVDTRTAWLDVVPGDYFELMAYQTSGGALNLLGPVTSNYEGSWLEAEFR